MATVIVNGGQAIITNLVSGLGGTVPKYIGWGTGAGTSAITDTTLFTEVDPGGNSSGTRTTGTETRVTTTVTNDTVQTAGTVTATTALAITNAGLWDNATIASGNLHFKGDFSVINLANGDSIAFTFKEKFS